MENISSSQLPQSIYGSTTSKETTAKLPSSQYQSTECILYGSITNLEKGQFIERLKGLCDPGGPVAFFEHNMVFKLSKEVYFDFFGDVRVRECLFW